MTDPTPPSPDAGMQRAVEALLDVLYPDRMGWSERLLHQMREDSSLAIAAADHARGRSWIDWRNDMENAPKDRDILLGQRGATAMHFSRWSKLALDWMFLPIGWTPDCWAERPAPPAWISPPELSACPDAFGRCHQAGRCLRNMLGCPHAPDTIASAATDGERSRLDLKPCPFCGGKPQLWKIAPDAFNIYCTTSTCGVKQSGTSPEAAIIAWNRRDRAQPLTGGPPQEPLIVEIEHLRADVATLVQVSADQRREIKRSRNLLNALFEFRDNANVEVGRLRTALATCVAALTRIEMRTLDDFPPFSAAPVEAFLPLIRQALAAARDDSKAAMDGKDA